MDTVYTVLYTISAVFFVVFVLQILAGFKPHINQPRGGGGDMIGEFFAYVSWVPVIGFIFFLIIGGFVHSAT
jgi:hypothetical protein